MSDLVDLQQEAEDALEKVWFVHSLEAIERTDITLSLRLHIRRDLFVQIFYGKQSNVLYMALVEGGRRVFGIDRDRDEWHMHPYEATERHEPMTIRLEPRPIMKFLARIEEMLLEKDLL